MEFWRSLANLASLATSSWPRKEFQVPGKRDRETPFEKRPKKCPSEL
jgi:hypothetical protein